MLCMTFTGVTKASVLAYALWYDKPNWLFQYFFNDAFNSDEALSEGGITIVIESSIMLFMGRCLSQYKPLIMSVKDCYFWKKKMVKKIFFIYF